ncbi:MAG: VWA domain-containing protein [Deltaproteobacteria bacterium]|nr:VWA domain-containing protein [Deltaproteobacteria bacterium]MCB9786758.1 VWA domain-containing protein [Deltaproteobacteria bacterium]
MSMSRSLPHKALVALALCLALVAPPAAARSQLPFSASGATSAHRPPAAKVLRRERPTLLAWELTDRALVALRDWTLAIGHRYRAAWLAAAAIPGRDALGAGEAAAGTFTRFSSVPCGSSTCTAVGNTCGDYICVDEACVWSATPAPTAAYCWADAGCSGAPTAQGACDLGTRECLDGSSSCSGVICPAAETCNGVDDDCDGKTDEDFAYAGLVVGKSCDGIGQCAVGIVECLDASTATCSTNPNGSAPQDEPEVCDYQDNDCDGVVDDGVTYDGGPAIGEPCDGVGSCGVGVVECFLPTVTAVCSTDRHGTADESEPEACNGADDDCDGLTDEAFTYADPVVGSARRVGLSCSGYGICGPGTVECASLFSATCSTNPGQPGSQAQPESCDGLDNDCDQQTDEQSPGIPLSRPCYTGPAGTEGHGVCKAGAETCGSGVFGSCVGQVKPSVADTSCNGKDNDCDDATDEDFTPTSCGTGACVNTSSCTAGVLTACVPTASSPDDQCDGVDNDCDGSTDESYPGATCGVGVCRSQATCVGGVPLACVPLLPTLVPEQGNCDGLDNDCDGSTDELYDDGVACTVSTCIGGVAQDIPDPSTCDDSEPCTRDICHPEFGCVNIPDNTATPDPAVEDGDPCTVLVCQGGTSVNVNDDSAEPDDGLFCTVDSCVAGMEQHDLAPGNCLIGGACYAAGEADPSDSCGVCFPEEGAADWSKLMLREHFDGSGIDWTLSDESGSGIGWQVDSERAHTLPNSLYMGDPATHTYGNGLRVEAVADSPTVALPAAVVTTLDFRLWLQTEAFNQAVAYDVLWVEVFEPSTGTVTPVWDSVTALGGTTHGAFRHVTVSLAAFAGRDVIVRFRFDSIDGEFNDYEGAYLDAVQLTTSCCATAADCNDGDPCTLDSCNAGTCEYTYTCTACTPEPVNMLVLLDGSASMNSPGGSASPQSRWEAATEVLGDQLDTYAAILNTALAVYPTPANGPCGVSGALDLPFHSTADDFRTFMGGLTPPGSTPMADGLLAAGSIYAASGLGGAQYVLLITDGKESCGGDPLAAVQALAAAGIETYIIGYDPSGMGLDHATLNDMAEDGGHALPITTAADPAYYLAQNAEELDLAVQSVLADASGEQCNGVDDDCDGLTDEGVQPLACNISCGLVGLPGQSYCVGGAYSPCTVSPDIEICNGDDDNCSGTIDDPWVDATGPVLNAPCTVGAGGCQRPGVYVCPPDQVSEAVCNAVPGAPGPETCDSIDNDCDGSTDEGLTRDCSNACGYGIETCILGVYTDCTAPPLTPDTQCDDIDNDCDGTTDESFPDRGAPCDGSDADLCVFGTWTCASSELALECVNEYPSGLVEICDAAADDEDCDGQSNEEGALGCKLFYKDVDRDGFGKGAPRCLCEASGNWDTLFNGDCNDNQPASFPGNPEKCDAIDNDCNGLTDDDITKPGHPPITQVCYTGPSGTVGIGICRYGIQTCGGGVWGACVGDIVPRVEVCNGLDDNCNGYNDGQEPGDSTSNDLACTDVTFCRFSDCGCRDWRSNGVWSCQVD